VFVYDGSNPRQRLEGVTHAAAAARRGELVAVNVDGAYALITDAFSWRGIERIREIKDRPDMGVPVLVGRIAAAEGVAMFAGESALVAHAIMKACWPGPLTLLARAQPSLPWPCTPDGVVAVRMPVHPWTLEIIRTLGPTACVPAHAPEAEPFQGIEQVIEAYGEAVSTYLDGGPCLPDQTSTIVDVTGEQAVLVREGAFTREYLTSIAPELA
jgi:tRNA threonylcarbamoyl adenosine modification protein (Sua5/YciO/YrdC/YwlC family)